MRFRKCDACQTTILSGVEYIKCSKQAFTNKKMVSEVAGDLCLPCWNTIKERGDKK